MQNKIIGFERESCRKIPHISIRRLAQRQIDLGISEKLGGRKDGWMIPIIS
jgi:hypothetical protein